MSWKTGIELVAVQCMCNGSVPLRVAAFNTLCTQSGDSSPRPAAHTLEPDVSSRSRRARAAGPSSRAFAQKPLELPLAMLKGLVGL